MHVKCLPIIWKLEKELHKQVHKLKYQHADPGVDGAAAPFHSRWLRGPKRQCVAVLRFPTSMSESCLAPAQAGRTWLRIWIPPHPVPSASPGESLTFNLTTVIMTHLFKDSFTLRIKLKTLKWLSGFL